MIKKELFELWEQTLLLLKDKLSKHSFETWLTSLKPIDYINNILFIEAPNHFSRDWLIDRYAPVIKDALKEILKTEVGVQFFSTSEIPKSILNNKNEQKQKSKINYENMLNPKYVFDTFVVGNSNRFAHAAALAVSESPAKAYNPLFIYGGVGLGKTHLMHAISHYIIEHNSHLEICYVTSEKFTNELINAIKDDQTEEFRNKYRKKDILLVDDIQFLVGKERTQEEFFHTFNTLYESNKQIVISSDRPPKDIPTLEDRLRSRFEWGLITDIQAPDYETRIAILQKKAQMEGFFLPDDTIAYIASKIKSNIRELEGALNRVIAYASLNNFEVTTDLAAEILKDTLPRPKPKKITVSTIQKIVANFFGIKTEDLKSKKRTRSIAYPRQIAMYLARELTDLSLPRIGEEFGGRDHSTVHHACYKISTDFMNDDTLQEQINQLINTIKNQ